MIQDIFPEHLNNAYRNIKPSGENLVLCFTGNGVFAKFSQGRLSFPTRKDFAEECECIYAFSAGEQEAGRTGGCMDFLKSDVRTIYQRYLLPTLGSALAMSIYSIVDTMAVGRYAGPAGTAALAVVNPVYVIMVVIAFLCATGGSVRFGNALGRGDRREANAYFCASLVLCALMTALTWILLLLRYREIFVFFGANEEILPVASEYGIWIDPLLYLQPA